MVLLDPEDTPVGNLKIVIKFDDLVSEITNSRWWQDDAACIADRESGEIILTSNRMQRRKKLGETGDPLEKELLELFGQESVGTILGPGMPPARVAGFHRLETFPWVLVFIADGKTILAPIIHFRNGFIIGAVCLVVTTYLIIRFNVEQITGTIQHLSRRAVSVAKGDYEEKIAVNSNDEIGRLATSFNAMIDGLKERDLIRNTFGQYVDPDFARDLMKRPEAGRLGGRNQEVAVLMADIRGFTPMAESLSPEATIHILNRYFSVMIPLIGKHSGIIVDFIGDAVLAFFEPMGGSFSDTADRCVQCAFQMQRELNALNPLLASQNLPEIKIGIGIHSGPVVVGIIGSKTRKKYGIVGSCVNVCQRIQGQSTAGEIVVSDSVYREVASRVIKKRSQFATLKGVSSPLMLHAIKPIWNASTPIKKELK
jgi:class 3 adenylate cyclase